MEPPTPTLIINMFVVVSSTTHYGSSKAWKGVFIPTYFSLNKTYILPFVVDFQLRCVLFSSWTTAMLDKVCGNLQEQNVGLNSFILTWTRYYKFRLMGLSFYFKWHCGVYSFFQFVNVALICKISFVKIGSQYLVFFSFSLIC